MTIFVEWIKTDMGTPKQFLSNTKPKVCKNRIMGMNGSKPMQNLLELVSEHEIYRTE